MRSLGHLSITTLPNPCRRQVQPPGSVQDRKAHGSSRTPQAVDTRKAPNPNRQWLADLFLPANRDATRDTLRTKHTENRTLRARATRGRTRGGDLPAAESSSLPRQPARISPRRRCSLRLPQPAECWLFYKAELISSECPRFPTSFRQSENSEMRNLSAQSTCYPRNA